MGIAFNTKPIDAALRYAEAPQPELQLTSSKKPPAAIKQSVSGPVSGADWGKVVQQMEGKDSHFSRGASAGEFALQVGPYAFRVSKTPRPMVYFGQSGARPLSEEQIGDLLTHFKGTFDSDVARALTRAQGEAFFEKLASPTWNVVKEYSDGVVKLSNGWGLRVDSRTAELMNHPKVQSGPTAFVKELIDADGISIMLRPVGTADIAFALGSEAHHNPESEQRARDLLGTLPGADKAFVQRAFQVGKSGASSLDRTLKESDLRQMVGELTGDAKQVAERIEKSTSVYGPLDIMTSNPLQAEMARLIKDWQQQRIKMPGDQHPMHYLAEAVQPLLADSVRAKVPFILEVGDTEYRFSKENTPKEHTSKEILKSESGVYWSSRELRMRPGQ